MKINFLLATLCLCATPHAMAQDSLSTRQWDLKGCIEYALDKNIQIRMDKIALEESNIDTKTAKADLFPSLSFSTGHNIINRPYMENSSIVDGTNVISTSNKTSYTGNYGLNASWMLYNGNKRLNTLDQQKINNRIAQLNVANSENSIQESITTTFIQILYATESVRINENTVQISEAQRNRGKELLNAGSISQSDYAQLESQYSADKYQLITSQATLQNYKLQLKQLLELDGEYEMQLALPDIDDTDVLTPLPAIADIYQAAVALRPEIEASRLNVETSQLDINIARSGYLPTVSLSAGIGTNHTTGNDFTFAEQIKTGWNNSVGVTLSIPIFNNRQTKSAVQKAKLQRQNSELELQDQQKSLYQTIEGLWLDANSAQHSYMAATEKVRSTQISFNLVNEQFNQGMKNTVELLTEKNNLLSAQQEQLQAKYMAVLNTQLLRFYAGENIHL